MIKLPFIERVCHLLKRVPASRDAGQASCVAYLGEVLTDPLTKKQFLITTTMEVFSNIPREDLKRACSPFLSKLEKVFAAKGDFIC